MTQPEASATNAAAGAPRARPALKPRARRLDFRRSRFVAVMKVALPGFAVALLALLATWPTLRGIEVALQSDFGRSLFAAANDPRMFGPRVLGLDAAQQPFNLTADTAQRMPGAGKREVYELASPKADIAMSDGTWWALTANKGVYWRDRNLVELTEEVSLFQDRGYEFVTAAASIDLVKKTAAGTSPIRGQGPAAEIEAEGFRVNDGAGRIDFIGKSRLLLRPGAGAP